MCCAVKCLTSDQSLYGVVDAFSRLLEYSVPIAVGTTAGYRLSCEVDFTHDARVFTLMIYVRCSSDLLKFFVVSWST
jgi:hypothetical protein